MLGEQDWDRMEIKSWAAKDLIGLQQDGVKLHDNPSLERLILVMLTKPKRIKPGLLVYFDDITH